MYSSQVNTFQSTFIDAWMDQFNLLDNNSVNSRRYQSNQEISQAWLLQQNLPHIKIPNFDCSALVRVNFINKFKDILYDQNVFTRNQKLHYLQQHVTGEVKQAISGFANYSRGYIFSLKNLKYLFG